MSADLERVIQIVFRGVDDTGKIIQSISGDLDKMAGGVRSATQPLADMHDWVLKTQAALGALAIGGLALSIKAASDFDSQFREISTLLDEVGPGVDQFRQEIRNYAQDSTQSIEQINKAIYAAISAGVDYKDAIGLLTQAEQLSVAGRADLGASMLVLVSTLNAYGESMDEAGRYADILFTTVKEGQTTLPELAQSLSGVTSLAAAAGVPFETVAAALATLTAKGMPTAEAMTALRGVISAIISPTKQAADYAAELGIEFSASAMKSKGLEVVLKDVWTATDGNVEAVARLFGNVRGLTGVLAAFGQDGGDLFIEKQEKMRSAAVVTATAHEKMSEDIKLINQKLVNNLQLTLAAIGDEVLSEYGDMVEGITEIFKAIQSAIQAGAFKEVFDVLRLLADDITQTFEGIAKALPEALGNVDFSRFAQSIRSLATEASGILNALFGNVDLTSADGLAKAMQRIVDIITVITEVSSSIIREWQTWAEWLGNLAGKAGEADQATTEWIGKLLQKGKEINIIAGAVQSLAGFMGDLGNLIKIITAQKLVNLIAGLGNTSGAFGGLGTAVNAAIGTTAGQLGLLGLAGTIGWTIGTLLNDYVPAVGKAAQAVYGWVDSLIDFTKTQGGAERATKATDALIEAIVRNIHNFGEEVSDLRGKLQDLGHDIEGMDDVAVLRFAYEEDHLSREDAEAMVASFRQRMKDEPAEVPVVISGEDDLREQLRQAGVLIEEELEDKTVVVEAELVEESVEEAKKKLEEALPPDKQIEIQLEFEKLEVQKFEAQMKALETHFEWKAKLDIAEVEANAKKVASIMESVTQSIRTSGEVLTGIFSNVKELSGAGFWKGEIATMIREQERMQWKALDIQERMANAEIDWMKARTDAISKEQALIQVDGAGLQPHLEAIMWELLRAIQIRVNQQGLSMLLGM